MHFCIVEVAPLLKIQILLCQLQFDLQAGCLQIYIYIVTLPDFCLEFGQNKMFLHYNQCALSDQPLSGTYCLYLSCTRWTEESLGGCVLRRHGFQYTFHAVAKPTEYNDLWSELNAGHNNVIWTEIINAQRKLPEVSTPVTSTEKGEPSTHRLLVATEKE